jgi:hypothetical protein
MYPEIPGQFSQKRGLTICAKGDNAQTKAEGIKPCFGTPECTVFEFEFGQTTMQGVIRIFLSLGLLRLHRRNRIKLSIDMRVGTRLASVQQTTLTGIHSTRRTRDGKQQLQCHVGHSH